MPAILALIFRLFVYLASMLVGAGSTTVVTKVLQKRRERKAAKKTPVPKDTH